MFIICSKPSPSWTDLFGIPVGELNDVALWKRRSRLEALANRNGGLQLVHPTAGQEHFVALLGDDAGAGQLAVTSPNAMDRLAEPGGLLLFRSAPTEDFLQVHFEDRGKGCFFRRVEPVDLGLHGNYLDRHEHGLCRRCFKWSSESPENAEHVLNIDIALRPELWSQSTSQREIAWLNPVIVRLPLGGDDLACRGCSHHEPSVDSNPLTRDEERRLVLRCLTDPSSLLYCQPVFDDRYNVRMAMLDRLNEWRNEQNQSGAERLYFGPDKTTNSTDTARLDAPTWLPFLALDSLKGAFAVSDHGNNPRYTWSAPASLQNGNAWWFAKHLLGRWGGDEERPAQTFKAFPPTTRTRDQTGHPSVVSFPLGSLSDLLSPGGMLRSASSTQSGDRELQQRISEFLERPEVEQASLLDALRAAWHVELSDVEPLRHRVLFDKAEFLTRLCSSVLQPQSEVWLKLDLPNHTLNHSMERQAVAALEDRWVNVFETPPLGQRDWIERVVGTAGRQREEDVNIRFDSGWWVDWLETFCTARWDAAIYLETDSLLLDQGRVDYGHLDQEPAYYRQSEFVTF